jgi:hypothetical protein
MFNIRSATQIIEKVGDSIEWLFGESRIGPKSRRSGPDRLPHLFTRHCLCSFASPVVDLVVLNRGAALAGATTRRLSFGNA